MTPTPGRSIFVDTNILIYASFSGTAFHEAARSRLSSLQAAGAAIWTTRQVLREYLAATTRPGTIVPPPDFVALFLAIRQFEAQFEIADDDAPVTAFLLQLLASRTIQGKQIHDANIVATMLRNKIPALLTHNTVDFARYSTEIVVLPLALR